MLLETTSIRLFTNCIHLIGFLNLETGSSIMNLSTTSFFKKLIRLLRTETRFTKYGCKNNHTQIITQDAEL